jgi:predicted membrane chloride channel (bestrophin family)
MMTARIQAGGLAIPPPLLSRTYQVLSDGTAAAMQARKVSHVEFPFALRQLLAVLLTAFTVLAPMCLCAFVNSTPLVIILAFFVLLGYIALNETARELEQPFGFEANDLTVTQYQKDFNHKLAQLLDLRIPELAYVQHTDFSQNHLSGGYARAIQTFSRSRPARPTFS